MNDVERVSFIAVNFTALKAYFGVDPYTLSVEQVESYQEILATCASAAQAKVTGPRRDFVTPRDFVDYVSNRNGALAATKRIEDIAANEMRMRDTKAPEARETRGDDVPKLSGEMVRYTFRAGTIRRDGTVIASIGGKEVADEPAKSPFPPIRKFFVNGVEVPEAVWMATGDKSVPVRDDVDVQREQDDLKMLKPGTPVRGASGKVIGHVAADALPKPTSFTLSIGDVVVARERPEPGLDEALAYRLFVSDPELVAKIEVNADVWRRYDHGISVMDYSYVTRALRLAWLFNEPELRKRAEDRATEILCDREVPVAPGPWCDRATYQAIEAFAERAKAPIADVVRFANDVTKCFPEGDDAAKRAVVRESLAAKIDPATLADADKFASVDRSEIVWRESPLRKVIAAIALKEILARVGDIRSRGQVERANAKLMMISAVEVPVDPRANVDLEGEAFADVKLGLLK